MSMTENTNKTPRMQRVTLFLRDLPKLYVNRNEVKLNRGINNVKQPPIRIAEYEQEFVKELPVLLRNKMKMKADRNTSVMKQAFEDAFIVAVEKGKHKDKTVSMIARKLGVQKEKNS